MRELAALGLAELTSAGWAATGDLEAAADEVGATELHQQVFLEHKHHRDTWRELIAAWARSSADGGWWLEEPPDWLEAVAG